MRLSFLCLIAVSTAASTRRPHILMVVADDLGWNDVSFHGSTQIPTPTLDELANDGVQLNNYYVQPVCSPTRSCLLTGRHVIHSGIYDPDCGQGTTYAVPLNFTMLPRHLKAFNYESHAVGKWHLGMFSPSVLPTGRGFDTFFGYYGGAEDYFKHDVQNFLDLHNDSVQDGIGAAFGYNGQYSTHIYAQRAEAIIADFAKRHPQTERQQDGDDTSLFMYLAWQAIHSPDEAPSSYTDRFNATIPDTPDGVGQHRRIVAGMVAALDEGMANVTAALRAHGLWEDTLLFFTADNGGPAQGFNSNMASNWPLRGMKRTLWEGGVRANGFITGAGLKKTRYVSDVLLHATDIPVSLLSVAANGLDADPTSESWVDASVHPALLEAMRERGEPPMQLGDGIDNWKALATGAVSARTEVIHESHPAGTDDGNGQAIRVGDFKLIFEKGPMWHGPPNDLWYDSGSNPASYNHTLDCGGKPPLPNATGYCDPDKLPCLFNVRDDPCEFFDLSSQHPDVVQRLKKRLADYQATSVPVDFHKLQGANCTASSPKAHKAWNNSWQPFCT